MKTIMVVFAVSLVIPLCGQNQIETFITEAQGFLEQKDYRQAQLSLQDAIREIDILIAAQVAEALPEEVNGLKAEETNTDGTGMMGMMGGGMQITKMYRHPDKPENEAEVVMLANAPLLTSMNMFLTNPSMMGEGYKSVRVGTRRAILKSETQDYWDDNGNSKPIRSTEIQIPLSQTLITINARGFASEQEELAFAGKLEIEKIREMLGE